MGPGAMGEESQVTKLSDEACDLFKAMPKSQNKPGHKMTHFCVCVCVFSALTPLTQFRDAATSAPASG